VANVVQSVVIKQDLLDNEGSDSSGELLSSLHDPEAEWDDLGLHQESDSITVIALRIIRLFYLTLTRAPMTPKLVTLKFSKGFDLLVVLRNGYRKRGM
jgi:hypothetical protein